MGKGDHKTRRGKIFLSSYGKLRQRKKNTPAFISDNIKPDAEKGTETTKAEAATKTEKKAAPKKTTAKKTTATKTETKKAPAAKKPAAKKTTKEDTGTDKKEEAVKDEK